MTTWKFWDSAKEMIDEVFPDEKKLKKNDFFMLRMGMEMGKIRNKNYSKEDAIAYMQASFIKVKLELKQVDKETEYQLEHLYGIKPKHKKEDSYESLCDFIDAIPNDASIQLYFDDDNIQDTLVDDVVILINCPGNDDLRIKASYIIIYSNKGFTCKSARANDVLIITNRIRARKIKADHVAICTDDEQIDLIKSVYEPMQYNPQNEYTWDVNELENKFEKFIFDNINNFNTEVDEDDIDDMEIEGYGNEKV